jgi:hypothetical protein
MEDSERGRGLAARHHPNRMNVAPGRLSPGEYPGLLGGEVRLGEEYVCFQIGRVLELRNWVTGGGWRGRG